MPKCILEGTQDCAIRAYFIGLTRDEAADDCGMSGGAVSETWRILERKIGADGKATRDLAIQLKRANCTAAEAVRGATISGLLDRLGIETDFAEDFLTRFLEACRKKGRSPEAAADAAARLLDIESSSGLPHEKILATAEQKAAELKKSKEDSEGLKRTVHELEVRRDTLLRENKVTEEDLSGYRAAREALKPHGLDFEDPRRLVNALNAAKELGYDVEHIVESITWHLSLVKSSMELEEENKKENTKLKELKEKTVGLSTIISKQETGIRQAQDLAKLGFDNAALSTLKQTLVEIGAKNGLEPKAIHQKFFADLKDQYGPKVGFEVELTRLQSAFTTLGLQVEATKGELTTLDNRYRSRRAAVDAMEKLRMLGTVPEDIAAWHDILDKAGTSVAQFYEELKEWANLRELREAGKGELALMLKAITERRFELHKLNERLPEVKGAIKAVQVDSVNAIKSASSKANDQLASIGGKLREASSSWEKFLAELGGLPEDMKRVREQIAKAMEVGERIGKLEATTPIYKIVLGEETARGETLPTMLVLLQKFQAWLETHLPGSGLIQMVSALISALSAEAGR